VSSIPGNTFWTYSLAHYARPEVARCCLDYQDHQGANVNLLLFCCWVGRQNLLLSADQLRQAILQIECWDNHAVKPLRQARQYVAVSSLFTSPELGLKKGDVVNSFQQAELMAEQVVQDVLFHWWETQDANVLDEPLVDSDGGSVISRAQAKNLNRYLALLGADVVPEGSPLLWPLDTD
jgi:uncharacterized protein (TIGR02444 family)